MIVWQLRDMNETYDLISIGDSTIDVFMEIEDYRGLVQDGKKYLGLDHGAKIGVKKMTRIAAVGNSANNAIGSSRLGLKTAIYTHVGSDPSGQEMVAIFKEEGVSTDFVHIDEGKKSNFSSVINYGAERVIFVYHEHRDYNLPELPPSKWVYYSSSSEGHDILHEQIPSYIQKSGAKLGFNPGTFQLKEGLLGIAPILKATYVLILNRQEAHGLVGGDEADTKNLQQKLHETGPKVVIITDARNGTFAFDSESGRYLHAGIPEDSPVVERTGAGDAFSTGSIAAMVKGQGLAEALVWGTLSSTSVVQHIGAREGLLTPEGMEEMKQRWAGDFEVKEF